MVGQSNLDFEEILISRQQSEESLKETLLHEVLHTIFGSQDMASGLSCENPEEYIVSVYAANLMQVLQDNDWLKDFLWV